jgi:hypothetical protein
MFSLFSQHFRKQSQAFARFARAFARVARAFVSIRTIRKGFGGGWLISDTLKHWKGVYMQFATHLLCNRFICKAFTSIRKGICKHLQDAQGHS